MTEMLTERCVLVHTLFQYTNPSLGKVKPIAEIVDGQLVPITSEGFCRSMEVFITSHYDELEKKFPDHQLFKLKVNKNNKKSETIDTVNPGAVTCEYVATASMAEPIQAKDFFEILNTPLPAAEDRRVTLSAGLPSTRYIFLNDDEYIYGPFRWRSVDSSGLLSILIDFIDAPLPGVTLTSFQTYRVQKKFVEPMIVQSKESNAKKIIYGLSFIEKGEYEYFDYASDVEIIKFCLKLQSDTGARVLEKSKAEALALQVLKNPRNASSQIIKNRLSRLPTLISHISNLQSDLDEALGAAFATETGKDILAKFIEANELRFLDRLKREKQSEIEKSAAAMESELQKAKQRLIDIDREKQQANDQLQEIRDQIRKQSESNKSEKIETAIAEVNTTYQQRKNELAELEAQISSREGLLGGHKTLEQIKNEVSKQITLEDHYKGINKKLEDTHQQLQSEVGKSAEHLRAKLIELKPFVDSINGSYFPETAQSRIVSVKTHAFTSVEPLVNRQREIVQAVAGQLASEGRILNDSEVANLLITTQQSFITVLAGLPGSGKTTLARLLAKVQGLKARLQEVPVARGWTSQKDLIGYFNPLTSRFQPSNTGMYEYLCALSSETDSNAGMAYTLLDEANLSPLEHYWSAFMDMADRKEERILRLGQQSLSIPSHFRFIATINYDGTTEPLSQRLVNRAPIIVIEESDLAISTPLNHKNTSVELPISAIQMEELFGTDTDIPKFDPSEEACFERIKNTLTEQTVASRGRPVIISPRKEKAMRHYCNKARALMGEDHDLAAFDQAVLQHVLPLINGTGVHFKARLEALKNDLDNLTLLHSAKYLEKMISYGSQDLHSYDFFCW